MAQSGYTPIQLYYSTTAAAQPTTANLSSGELALNILDGKLYFKNSSNVITLLASSATAVDNVTVGTTTVTSGTSGYALYNNGGVLGNVANTGTGSNVLATSPTLTTPILGTPTSVTLTNATGLPLSTGVTGTLGATNGGTGQATYATGDILYASASNTLSKLTAGSNGQVLTLALGVPSWVNSTSGGTVTSVGMSVPTFLSVAGSPITSSGTLAVTLSGTALPTTSGGTGLTSFTSGGALYATSTSALTTGTLPIASGGTGQTTASAAFNALSPMTTAGDVIYGGTSGAGTRLAIGTAGQVLTVNGGATAPTWTTISTGLTVGTTAIASGTSGRVLYDNAGTLGEYTVTGTAGSVVLSTAPTFTTSITSPLVLGGSAVGSTLTLQSTSGVGATDAINLKVGNNGAITGLSISTAGVTTLSSALPAGSGGTGLTGFTAANNAIYSSSASALTAGTLPVAAGGTGATSLTANYVILGNGTSAVTGVAPGTNGNVLTSNGTTWTSAASATAATGVTDYTFTSTTSNFTLTSSSNQVVRLLGDATTATGVQSITMPAMNSGMTAGYGRFVFQNYSPYTIALKDSGGTVRQFIYGATEYNLTIKDIATATGFWYTAAGYSTLAQVGSYSTLTSPLVTSGDVITVAQNVYLSSTAFAIVWGEVNGDANAIYAKLFTINTTTKVITAQNQVTVLARTSAQPLRVSNLYYDSDQAGHALVVSTGFQYDDVGCGNWTSRGGGCYFGLSVSGTTLYATSVTILPGLGSSTGPGTTFLSTCNYIGYLGSNNAYAFSITYPTTVSPSHSVIYAACTITGTTAPVLTASASNTTVVIGAGATASYGSRTGLTTFTMGCAATSTIGVAISCTPAANTFTKVNRTASTRLAIEQSFYAQNSSFAMGGFLYCSGKVIVGSYSYAITNAGAAGVTSTQQTSVAAKGFLTPNYSNVTIPSTGLFSVARNGYFDATTLTTGGNGGFFTASIAATDFNLNGSYTSGWNYSGYAWGSAYLSTSTMINLNTWSTSGGQLIYYYDLASPITAI
jgi:hypothetical protein